MTRLGYIMCLAVSLSLWQPSAAAQGDSTFDWIGFHRANDQSWAQRTGLSAREIRELRLAAGVADDEPSNPVDMIDARTLPGERILFVTAVGSGHCLDVNVFQHRVRGFKLLWSESETPDGGGFCHPSVCGSATVSATRKNQVVVTVPIQLEGAPMGVCDNNLILTYRGIGKTYSLVGTEHRASRCGAEAYQVALQMAFADPDESAPESVERLVTVHVFPSFKPESAITFEKTANGLTISRLAFRQQAWRQLAVFDRNLTPSQCIAEAKSIPIERTRVNISPGDAQRLLDELSRIDLNTDSCPRLPDGSCALIFHGTSFTVVLEDGRRLHLIDVSGMKHVRSENPALLHWITSLREFVKLREQPSHN